MAITGVNATYNYISATFADLPTAPGPGQWAFVTDTSKSWFSTNGTWVDMTPGAASIADGDKGDITTSGSGATWTIDNDAVTYAKIQNVVTDRLLGRDTAGSGDVEELTVGGGVEFTGSGGIQTSALTGDVTKTAGGTSTTIANDAVTYAKMQNVSATDKVLGRSTAGSGDVEEISCTAAGRAMIGAASAAAQAALLGSSFAPYLYSFDNPPGSPHSYNDEFTATTLNAKWTASSTGTTNPITTGTVNPVSSLTTPVYDLSTWPSWLLVQSDDSSAGAIKFDQTVSLDTNATLFICCSTDNRAFNAANESKVGVAFINSGSATDYVAGYLDNATGAGLRCSLLVSNAGALTAINGAVVAEATPRGKCYLVLWKSTNAYYFGYAQGDGVFSVVGPVNKTGTTTFDIIRLNYYTANETPSGMAGWDFFRYYPSITYALRN